MKGKHALKFLYLHKRERVSYPRLLNLRINSAEDDPKNGPHSGLMATSLQKIGERNLRKDVNKAPFSMAWDGDEGP